MSQWQQIELSLRARSRGFHLITDEIVSQLPQLADYTIGLAHFFIQHTSAGLCLNENADPTVRSDMRAWFDHSVAEDTAYFVHTYEGPDDMPAHIKTVLSGNQLSIPIRHGRLALGTWQGIYLGEYRDHGGSRRLIVTLQGSAN